ncbi:hypothetical protein [Vulgatibacter sp.]|uniref:hypothetical protein n=1 Tax=Vulgatibacter sp. TaxID=1971226 RepID=UPI00356594A9
MRRIVSLLAILLLVLPVGAGAQLGNTRALPSGFLYVGTGPGFNFGGHSLPRALYMDALTAGYVFSNGLDLSYSLSGMNWFPDENDWSITMNRFAVGWRPFMRDPLPMIQPYLQAGGSVGGEGRWVCEPEPECDPSRNSCRDVCGRSNWVGGFFAGGGFDVTSRLFDVGNQQVLFYVGTQLRYEYVGSRYHMGVITFPIGLKLL